jgi:hypothetical protein
MGDRCVNMENVDRYPLSWPFGWKRTLASQRKVSRFSASSYGTYSGGGSYRRARELTVYDARKRLDMELSRLRARDVVLSTNVELTSYGEPRSGRRPPDDPGVAVYFRLSGKDRVLACDAWTTVAGNIAAIAAHIDCIRGIDRYGVGTLDQAFAGYDALPPPSADNRAPWRGMLGFKPDTIVTRADVDVMYRTAAKRAATDEGALLQLNLAREAAYNELPE